MKLTTKTLKRLIKEELSMINEKEMINELYGPEGNLTVQEIKDAFKEIAEKEKHKSGWMYQLMNLKYSFLLSSIVFTFTSALSCSNNEAPDATATASMCVEQDL